MATLPPILIVDDDADDIFIFKRLLVKGGIENKIVAFEDPEGAQAYLRFEAGNPERAFVPFLMMTDLKMPRLNGVELTQWARAQPGLNEMRIVILSSSGDPADEQRALAAGADQFLRKYPGAQQLCRLVTRAGGRCVGVQAE